MKKLYVLAMVLFTSLQVSANDFTTEITGGLTYQEPPAEFDITLIEYLHEFNDSNGALDVMVKTDLNDNEMNLDCRGDNSYLNIKNSRGNTKIVKFDTAQTCQLGLKCLKSGGNVQLIIRTEDKAIIEMNLSEDCETKSPAPFYWGNTTDLNLEQQNV